MSLQSEWLPTREKETDKQSGKNLTGLRILIMLMRM